MHDFSSLFLNWRDRKLIYIFSNYLYNKPVQIVMANLYLLCLRYQVHYRDNMSSEILFKFSELYVTAHTDLYHQVLTWSGKDRALAAGGYASVRPASTSPGSSSWRRRTLCRWAPDCSTTLRTSLTQVSSWVPAKQLPGSWPFHHATLKSADSSFDQK